MSIKNDKVKEKQVSLPQLKPDKRDEQIAVLQNELAESNDSRLEERFWWGMLTAFMFDCFIFSHVPFMLALLLFLFQMVPFIYFAKKLGIDEAAVMLDRISSVIADKFSDGKS